ncbi:Putative flavin-containing monoamine oxidase A [Fusarium odoratissimum]|uniref:Amine oxidase n=1 Tax=Fusarium oxysporum f. sp. cubense (strain race 4) TaxID=2502994 RepID=N1S7M0_FUSC4|nr:Putative flavin-containing monoamine oxidase A [Fusarium odoratissimum]
MAQNFQVVIVGAGLSGLRATREVHNAGLSYIVLEAMDRVGGKTLSVQASDGNGVVDLGASWINDTSQSEIYKLAKEFGFDLVEQRTEGSSLYRDEMGQVHCIPFEMPAKLEPKQLKEVEQFMQILSDYAERCDIDDPSNVPDAKYLDSVTVAEFIAGFKDPSASPLVNSITRSLLGVESDEPSALFFLDILKRGTGLKNVISDFKDGAQYLRNRQGNQAFCDRLAAGLNSGSVKISSAVKAITQKEGEDCLVETINGDVYRANRVIVSVPTPLYPLIHFEPSLPPAKKKLGDSAKSGYYIKTILVYAEPWWHSAGLSGVYSSTDGPVVFTHDTCIPQDGQYSITCFHAGDPGRKWSKLPAEERKQVVLQDICTAFGTVVDNIPEPINVIEKDWTKDPWAQGGPGPVWRPGFLAGESGKAIAEPFGNIHFVGTETSSVWRGYMDGAVRSGIRGGQEVVTSLDKVFGSTILSKYLSSRLPPWDWRKKSVPVGYCAPERMHQINPTFASDMWSYMCIFTELYLKWPLFGPGFFGGGFRFVAELFVRVLGPLPLSWKGSYDGDGEPDESWYDQSKVSEPEMSLESRVTQSRDTVEPAEQQLVLSILRRGFSYLLEERLSAGELLEDASFKALMDSLVHAGCYS